MPSETFVIAAPEIDDMGVAKLSIPGREDAVRDGLRALFSTYLLQGLGEEDRGTAELVLAEALNNIVEHAYAQHGGEIEITLQLRRDGLSFTILDSGLQMPGGKLPAGILPEINAFEDLPEGGFGWHLIRTLSKDLTYERVSGRNKLSFRIAPEGSLS